MLAVSKTRSASELHALYQLGQRHFGESYLQEALEKIDQLHNCDIEWHFIGPIQSNKTRDIANHFSWIHSVDRLKIARRLSEQRTDSLPPLNICLQVNVSGEASKSGCSLEELPQLAADVAKLPHLNLRGLMAIPAPSNNFETQRHPYQTLREALGELNTQGHQLDTLSMGMSGDLRAAIAEGATLVRIGTALFGPRRAKADALT
ncbi:MAG TPA: YggS family pyridoxal phosphate-dependent enzyme [Halieaceae bacterium]|nr:YggS family pyridoxal phosphate-dependent enzyme [Halieaceae bacterium]